MKKIKILEKGNNYIIYDWESKRPWPYKNISHVCHQEYKHNDYYQILTQSISSPLTKNNIVDGNNYFSYTHIENIDNKKCAVYCIFLDEQKTNIPDTVYSNFTYFFIPSYMKNINKTINEIVSNL